ncbi:ABC transporter substrate-binding protein [Amycolatopsis endophytica]|uniref:Peptide/nickel transport system substrate-binding protein n=1 Tax=Amycolatopsis endophytica TaxID=860233 RepID=A0A853BAI9_9PSEU|nr:ABC transporter substrate-binding protein [Amycolatopsis endophytica]NYI91426.1 peptide/nickel transport system substrate-binding protein [Amycolatopsis endophytica]
MTRIPGKGRTRRVALAVFASAAVALTGCGTTGGAGGAADGEITVAGTYAIENLDAASPSGGGSTGTQLVSLQIFSRLVKPRADGTLEGDLATTWKADPTASEWTFTLRPGVTFSDGRDLTSADVVAAFTRFLELKSTNANNFTGDTMTATSPTEVVLKSPKPDAAIPYKLALFYVVPGTVTGEDPAFFKNPVGSGPFKVERFDPSGTVVLVPNETYYGGAPALKRVTLRKMPELAARLTALRSGEVDLIWGIPDDQLPQLQQDPALTVQTAQSTAVFTMWFNSSVPALTKPEVRRALWQAVDFATIIKQLYPQTGTLSESPVSPVTVGYVPQQPVRYDPAAAKAALQAAGFDFSAKLRLQFANAEFRQFNQAVVSDLAKIGVQVDLREKEQAVFTSDLLAMNWDINFQQLSNPTFDGSNTLGRLYPCAAKRTGYCNPELDRLLTDAVATPDLGERTRLYGEASKIIWGDAVGMFPMAVKYAYAWNSSLSGVVPDPNGLPDFASIRAGGA